MLVMMFEDSPGTEDELRLCFWSQSRVLALGDFATQLGRLRERSVLIVEDDPTTSGWLASVTREMGMQAHLYACETFRFRPPNVDCVLLNLEQASHARRRASVDDGVVGYAASWDHQLEQRANRHACVFVLRMPLVDVRPVWHALATIVRLEPTGPRRQNLAADRRAVHLAVGAMERKHKLTPSDVQAVWWLLDSNDSYQKMAKLLKMDLSCVRSRCERLYERLDVSSRVAFLRTMLDTVAVFASSSPSLPNGELAKVEPDALNKARHKAIGA